MKRFATLAVMVAAVLLGGTGAALAASPPDGSIPVVSDCNAAWYVNGEDERALLPTQDPEGFTMGPDGGIVHHTITPTLLTAMPAGTLTTDVSEGAAPLLKFETPPATGYSTINVTSTGEFWSSKIAADQPGGQSHPVEHAADLIGLWSGYTLTTTVTTIGFGYGHDQGNISTTAELAWNGQSWDLTCKPKPSTSASPSTPKPSASSSHPAGAAATTQAPGAAGGLPVTGFPTAQVAGAGAGLLALGLLFLLARRRRDRFTA